MYTKHRKSPAWQAEIRTPSRVIVTMYEATGARDAAVIENNFDSNLERWGHMSGHEGVVAGWVAGSERAVVAGPLGIAKTLRRLLEAYPQLLVITAGAKLDLPKTRYEHISQVHHNELLRWAKRQTTDKHTAPWEGEFERAIALAATRRTASHTAAAAPMARR